MLHVALTGNIAAGKSAVAELFRRWGAVVIDADVLVREAQVPGTAEFDAIVHRFGAGVVAPDGTLDRPALRRLVLADPNALAGLNTIMHPAVHRRRAELVAAVRAGGAEVVVSVIPLLFEAADPAEFDAVVLVDAPEPLRRERLLATRDLTPAEASAMIAAQQPAEPKRARSDYVIDNNTDLATLERRAAEVWVALRRRATEGGHARA